MEIVDILLAGGAKIEAKNELGRTKQISMQHCLKKPKESMLVLTSGRLL